MKPPPFDYADPATLTDLLDILAAAGDDAAIIAGGQSLLPLMNLRLARPDLVIDPRHIAELHRVEFADDGLRVGAMVRAADLEAHTSLSTMRGLAEILALIGHSQIRARTTIGGSIAHADPAAELPALLVAVDGEVTLQSRDRGVRVVPAEEFFVGPLMTDRAVDEIITSIRFPYPAGMLRIAETAKRPGDFAIVGVIASFATSERLIRDPRIALFGVAATPIRARAAEALLQGREPSAELFAEAGTTVSRHLDPRDDIHGSAAYRRQLARALTQRALGAVA